MQISQDILNEINLNYLTPQLKNPDVDEHEFLGIKQHYKLLAFLSSQFNNKSIIDIGTHRGSSALALTYNKTNQIHSFDIIDKMQQHKIQNVSFYIENIFSALGFQKYKDLILNAPLIVLDVDPHDGKTELDFFYLLQMCDYKGLLFVDDIWHFKPMRDEFWYHIPSNQKYDLTPFGHFSGSGLISFDSTFKLQLSRPMKLSQSISSNDNWTIVTAYFDLTKRIDASNEIKERSPSFYLQHANMTMALNQNLVVYTDKASMKSLEKLRPLHLLKTKTKFIIREFEEFRLVHKWFDFIKDTRDQKGHPPDKRNTTSYYLFCMIRYVMLLETMKQNLFQSSHFAWCNICLERMDGHLSGPYFGDIWQEFRQKFSSCYIDYQPQALVLNSDVFFEYGRCSLCSGFFTGNLYYMTQFCSRIIEKFESMARQGYGLADEQLYSLIYFEDPTIFEIYLGDYFQMISNYGLIHFNPEAPVYNLIQHLFESGENNVLLKNSCEHWLYCYDQKTFSCSESYVVTVKQILCGLN